MLFGKYKNGNYTVEIYDDGTKVRENNLDFLEPEFPESMDIKITNQCDCGCAFCHEASVPDGQHGDILHAGFINTLRPYTELAIGGGNPMEHPDLVPFLCMLRDKKIIANITVNQKHFMEFLPLLKLLTEQRLIHGLGVSLTDIAQEFLSAIQQFPNAVLHVVAGIVTISDLEGLAYQNLKLLILGYKKFRRGANYYVCNEPKVDRNISYLKQVLPVILDGKWFKAVSFDNLAIKQLDVKRCLSEEEWDEFYMGDDGQFTMYVDMVNREYAVSSTSDTRYPLNYDIAKMFSTVREERSRNHGA